MPEVHRPGAAVFRRGRAGVALLRAKFSSYQESTLEDYKSLLCDDGVQPQVLEIHLLDVNEGEGVECDGVVFVSGGSNCSHNGQVFTT